MTTSLAVAKRKPQPDEDGPVPQDHATVRYKLAVRAKLETRGWNYDDLLAEMKRRTPSLKITSEALHLFLGAKKRAPTRSNTTFMAELNKALGIAPPPRSDPSDELAQLHDRIASRWWKISPRERAAVLAMFADDDSES